MMDGVLRRQNLGAPSPGASSLVHVINNDDVFDFANLGSGSKPVVVDAAEAPILALDLPDFLLSDRRGIRTESPDDETPSNSMMGHGDDAMHAHVSLGQRTLGGESMESDVVLSAGQCIESTGDDSLTEVATTISLEGPAFRYS